MGAGDTERLSTRSGLPLRCHLRAMGVSRGRRHRHGVARAIEL